MQVCLDLGWLGKEKGGGLVFGPLGSILLENYYTQYGRCALPGVSLS